MTTLAIGSSVTVSVRDTGTVAVATNGGFGSATITPVGGSASTVNFGPDPQRRIFGPYPEGASVAITNQSCNSLDYDAQGPSYDPTSVAITGGTLAGISSLAMTGAASGLTGLTLAGAGSNQITGMYHLTATLSPALVAANTTAEQTFAVSGVAVGDAIVVNKPTAQAGLGIVGARVSSAGNIGITFSNNTAAGITPTASEVYQILGIR